MAPKEHGQCGTWHGSCSTEYVRGVRLVRWEPGYWSVLQMAIMSAPCNGEEEMVKVGKPIEKDPKPAGAGIEGVIHGPA